MWTVWLIYYFAVVQTLILLINIGKDVFTGEEVAVKLESVTTKHPQLQIESRIYKLLQDGGKKQDIAMKFSATLVTLCFVQLYVSKMIKVTWIVMSSLYLPY